MTVPQQNLLCQYRYNPLDRLISHIHSPESPRQRFYCKSRLATEIQGTLHHSIVQHDDLLLAQQQRQEDMLDTTLLATDLQRSVLHSLKANHQRQSIAYSPYGHRQPANGLLSLLGFNGERPDPVTGHYLLGNGYRAFNPVLMRFNSPDSLSPFGRGGLNSYAYCLGDPVNRHDPSGHLSLNVMTRIFRWRARAAFEAAKKVGSIETRTVGVLQLNPEVKPHQAVLAKRKLDFMMDLAGEQRLRNERFLFDLSIAKRESGILKRTLELPATYNSRLNALEYLAVEGPDGISGYSTRRIYLAFDGKFDPDVPLNKRPKLNEVVEYGREIRQVKNHNPEFSLEANRLLKQNFIWPPHAPSR